MCSAKNSRPKRAMNARALSLTVLGRNAAKQIEAELGCSRSQAWRIVSTGHVPGRMRVAFIDLLDRAIAYSQQRLAEAEAEIREQRNAEMLQRAAGRRLAAHTPRPLMAARQDDQAETVLPLGDAP